MDTKISSFLVVLKITRCVDKCGYQHLESAKCEVCIFPYILKYILLLVNIMTIMRS